MLDPGGTVEISCSRVDWSVLRPRARLMVRQVGGGSLVERIAIPI